MKVYALLIKDRHCDEEMRVFSTADLAIAAARSYLAKYARFPEDIEEQQIERWLLYVKYSCEGDSVRVEELELDA